MPVLDPRYGTATWAIKAWVRGYARQKMASIPETFQASCAGKRASSAYPAHTSSSRLTRCVSAKYRGCLTVQISLQRCFVTDRQTDRRTDGQKQSLNPASAYARGVITTYFREDSASLPPSLPHIPSSERVAMQDQVRLSSGSESWERMETIGDTRL